jgi:hypothetical protein
MPVGGVAAVRLLRLDRSPYHAAAQKGTTDERRDGLVAVKMRRDSRCTVIGIYEEVV